jgi:hypothetical protein
MIQVHKIPPQTAEHFDPDRNSVGFLNEYENADLRCQIAEQKVDGYYIMYNDKKYEILNSGKLSEWPHGLYDQNMLLLARLFKSYRNPVTLNSMENE